jgi:phosphatidylserine/phosphatidylglycerophosphate/cardiolipin synthase-like enzyme
MRLKAQLVVVPCVSFAARARLAAEGGGLTPVEQLALRAIGLGLDNVDSLAEVMGLGTRPALDAVYDFWLRGYVVVDTAEAKIRLAGDAARAFSESTLNKLATAENNLEIVPLLQELVSGAVLPSVGRSRPPGSESTLVPTSRGVLDLAKVTRAELLDAVQLQVEMQARKLGRDLFVQEAWVEPAQLLVEAASGANICERRFLPLWADITQDMDSGRLQFSIVEAPRGLTPTQRQGLERGLALLAERLPDQLFFKRLREELSKAPAVDGVQASESAVDRLRRSANGLAGTGPGLVTQRHEQLAELHKEASHEVRTFALAQARVQLVTGYDDLESTALRLFQTAERQLVLGNPWIRSAALLEPPPGLPTSWFDALKQALGRGVQVFILWGIAADSMLDPRVANALGDLAARHPGLVFSRRSSTLHAKFVVRDAHETLVTSYNFLDPPVARDSLELGLLVAGEEDGSAPQAVLDLLEWSRDAFPDYLSAQRMLLLPNELGASEIAVSPIPGVPMVPAEEAASAGTTVGRAAIAYWEEAWKALADGLVAVATAQGCGVRLVVDREHREALWAALRTADRRLAVTSDRVSVDVVTDRFVRTLKSRLDAGTQAAFLFRRQGASDRTDGAAGRLLSEGVHLPDRCRVQEGRSHAKVLISDDTLLVGSFNFLSFSGDYDSGSRERAELSIRVDSPAVVEETLAVLAGAWPEAFEPLRDLGATRRAPDLVALPSQLQKLFASLATSSEPGRVFLDRFTSHDPWADLAALQRASCPDDLLMVGAAAALATAPNLACDAALQWTNRLAVARWKAHDFVGAALLLEGITRPAPLPSWLARLGASVDGALVEGALIPPALDDEQPGVLIAASALGIVAVLLAERFDLTDDLQRLGAVIGSPASRWIDATVGYVEATYQPLPLTLLRQRAGRERRAAEVAAARAEFETALASAETVGFLFPLGERTWARLKMDGCLLGVLRAALDGGDAAMAFPFLDRLRQGQVTIEDLMDDASMQVRDEHNRRISEPKRGSCLKRLRRAVEAATQWANLTTATGTSPSDVAILKFCRVLAVALGGLQLPEGVADDPRTAPAVCYARARLALLLAMGDET